jgi:hypothetical protein
LALLFLVQPTSLNPKARSGGSASGVNGEIVIPHGPNTGPVTAVRNIVLQTSLGRLKAGGHFDLYASHMPPAVLEQLMTNVAPCWVPVEIALMHYEACDKLNLNFDQLSTHGTSVGEHLQRAVLVSAAKKSRAEDLWTTSEQLHRMWPRLYQGGSVQVVKLGPKDKYVEQRGFLMNRYRHYREAQLAAFAAVYGSVGTQFTCLKVERASSDWDLVMYRMTWL